MKNPNSDALLLPEIIDKMVSPEIFTLARAISDHFHNIGIKHWQLGGIESRDYPRLQSANHGRQWER